MKKLRRESCPVLVRRVKIGQGGRRHARWDDHALGDKVDHRAVREGGVQAQAQCVREGGDGGRERTARARRVAGAGRVTWETSVHKGLENQN